MPGKQFWAFLCISSVFILSRIIFYSMGVRFDVSPLETAIHLIDPIWMKQDLWDSLFHMVNQPPFFNFFVASLYRVFPTHYTGVFHLVYLAHGLGLGIGLYCLMRYLKVSKVIAVVLCCYFIINPAVILLENWLMYTYLIMTWLCWSAVFLFRYLSYSHVRDLSGFVGLLMMLALTKSIFHLFWMVGLIVVLWWIRSQQRKQIVCVCILPVMIVAALYMKNFVIAGNFTTSRLWMTLNLYEMSVKHVPIDELVKLGRKNKISLFSTDAVYTDSMNYRPKQHQQKLERYIERPITGIPMLDALKKPTNGTVNYHSMFQRMLEDVRLDDAWYLIQHYSYSYKYSLLNAYRIMFFPAPTDVTFVNRTYIAEYENLYNFMFYRLNTINERKLYSEHLKIWQSYLSLRWDLLSSILYHYIVYLYLFLYGASIFFIYKYWSDSNMLPMCMVLLFMSVNIFYLIVGQ